MSLDVEIIFSNDECFISLGVGKGCEPECFVGCCGYHGMYGKSKRWIIENVLKED